MENKWLVFLAVGIGAFMSAIATSVVNIVLPVVSRDFGTDVSTIEWVVTVYLLMVSGLLLSFGRLGDLRGHKPVYISGFAVFSLGAFLCSLAPDPLTLVGFRSIQALGGAMLFSNSVAILTKNFPAAQRGQALGLLSMLTYAGLTVAPSLGGWLTDQFGWRSVFYLNAPIGLIAIFLSMRYVPRDAPSEKKESFDLIGAGTFMFGLMSLLLGLNQGYAWGWTSPLILALLVAAVMILGIFLLVEQHANSPMLDLSLFKQRLFSAAVASAIFNYICVYTVLFLMPFYLIQGRGFNPAQAGFILTAQPLVMAIAAPLSGTLSDRIGSRSLGTLGMIIFALGLWLLSCLSSTSSGSEMAIGLAVVGLGTGMFSSPNSSALMGSAPYRRQGIAAGILAAARNFGMVLGVGLAGAIFSTMQARGETFAGPSRIFDAISAGMFAAVIVALLGALTSAVRGRKTETFEIGTN